jgi:Polyketide cyclase / dehydrase and lipid transport
MIIIYILIAIAVLVVGFLVMAAMQPNDFRITRSLAMTAAAADVFPHVNDFHKWDAWSPWAKLDPAMKQTFAGAPAGAGAIYSWDGNKQVGSGRMTILDSLPSERVRIKLEFMRPFACTHTAEFTFKPEGDLTLVTWSMFGTKTFMFKAFGLIMSMDKMLGGEFEKGLAKMKVAAEGIPTPQP